MLEKLARVSTDDAFTAFSFLVFQCKNNQQPQQQQQQQQQPQQQQQTTSNIPPHLILVKPYPHPKLTNKLSSQSMHSSLSQL